MKKFFERLVKILIAQCMQLYSGINKECISFIKNEKYNFPI